MDLPPNPSAAQLTLRTLVRRLVAAPIVVFVVAAAHAPDDASANTGGGGGVITITPPCPQATLAYCQSTHASAAPQCAATCSSILSTAYQNSSSAKVAAGSTAGSIAPSTLSYGGRLYTASYGAFTENQTATVSTSLTYEAKRRADLVANGMPTPQSTKYDGVTTGTYDWHSKWLLNGPAVASCEEFVYEKYYDYERFRERAQQCRGDWSCVYNIAFSSQPGSLYRNGQLYQRDGVTPMVAQVQPYPHAPRTAMTNPYPNGTRDRNPYLAVHPGLYLGELTRLNGNHTPVFASTLSFTALPYPVTDELTLFKTIHDAQPAGMTSAEYADIARRMPTMAAAAQGWLSSQTSLTYGSATPYTTSAALDFLENPGLFYATCGGSPKYMNAAGTPILATLAPAQMNAQANADGAQVVIPNGPISPYPSYCGSDSAPLNSLAVTNLRIALDPALKLVLAELQHKSVIDGHVDQGCMDGTSRCDWSPAEMAKYLDLFDADKEYDFQRCIDLTGDDFSATFPAPQTADLANATAFDKYLTSANALLLQESLDVPVIDKHTIGQTFAGGDSKGDDSLLSASYSFNGSWMLHEHLRGSVAGESPADQWVCTGQATTHAQFSSSAHVLGAYVPIVSGSVDSAAGENTPGGFTSSSSGSVRGSSTLTPTSTGITTRYPITTQSETFYVPLPVTVSLDVYADIGVATTSQAGAWSSGCSSKAQDPAWSLSLNSSVTPSVSVTADASGSVGADYFGIGAEAGIEGTVTLFAFSMPISTTVAVGQQVSPVDGAQHNTFSVDASANWNLGMLDGDVKLFEEACFLIGCVRDEQTLFHWSAFHTGGPLMKPLKDAWPMQVLGFASKNWQPPTAAM